MSVDNGKKMRLTHRLYTGDVSYDFIGKRKIWYTVSAVAIVISIVVLLVRGLVLGIEFKGGADFQTPVTNATATTDTMRAAITDLRLPDMESVTVLKVGDTSMRIQTRSLETAEVTQVRGAIAKEAGVPVEEVAYSLIGASWGEQITRSGIIALVVFTVLVMLMIWMYFRDWKMSLAAIVALLHDLILTVGVYALVGFTVTPATVIGVLTILGYSLYDTVVVFDKVRENVAELDVRNRTYSEAANLAVNQVLIRSINTTIIGVLPVGALLIAGVFFLPTGPLVDLGLALFVGMIAGAYSSIFIAAPLLASLKEHEPAMIEHRARLEKRARKAEASARKAASDNVEVVTVVGEVAEPTGERRQTRNQPRSQRKGGR